MAYSNTQMPVGHPLNMASMAVLALGFVSWLILLAGVSALQHDCNAGVASLDSLSCGKAYSYQWWKTMLEIFVLLAVTGSILTGWLHMHRLILCTLLAIITVLLMDDCNTFLDAHSQDPIHDGFFRRINCYFAGTILCCIVNLLLLFTLGSDHSYGGSDMAPAATTPYATTPAATGAHMSNNHPTAASMKSANGMGGSTGTLNATPAAV